VHNPSGYTQHNDDYDNDSDRGGVAITARTQGWDIGAVGGVAAGFLEELVGRGYRPGTTAKQLQVMAHLSRRMAAQGFEPRDLRRTEIERFVKDRRASGRVQLVSARALVPLLRYLRDVAGAPAAGPRDAPTPAGALLERHADYLVVRGVGGQDGPRLLQRGARVPG
jgi:hypothetical protein